MKVECNNYFGGFNKFYHSLYFKLLLFDKNMITHVMAAVCL